MFFVKKNNNNINTLLGTALLVVVAVVVAILIITSMTTTQVATVTSPPTPTSNPGVITDTKDPQWKKYSNAKYGISFEFPADTNVTSPGKSVNFTITGKNNTGFWASISFPANTPFFNPPANVDVTQWVLHNKDYPLGSKVIKSSRTIAGVKAVHLINKAVETAGASDTYYIIKNGKLYEITLLDDPVNHNLTEKNHFLNSIQIK